jgi:hypothetical protein
MTEAEINAAVGMWAREAASIELPWNDIERALGQLPEPEACAVSDDRTALLVLGCTGTLFTVATNGGKVTVSSRPLTAERLSISLHWEETAATMRTHWVFRYLGEPDAGESWQKVSGSVSTDQDTGREQPDDRERFARLIASRAGWTGSAERPAEQARAEEPSGGDTETGLSRWRARTDVWGRPLDPRRR